MLLFNLYSDVLLATARCFVENKSTVRKVAKELKVSKSTVHKRLKEFVNRPHSNVEERKLADAVQQLILKNTQERHIRGGNKTRERFLMMKQTRACKK